MAGQATIGELRAEMGAEWQAFKADMDRARAAVRQSTQDINRNFGRTNAALGAVTKGFRLAAGAAGVFGVALGARAFVNFVQHAIDAADEIAKTADKLGVGTEALQELRYAADLAGVSTQTFDLALQRFVRRAAEAAKGTGEAKDAFKEMGIQLTDGNGRLRQAEDLLGDVAEFMGKTSDAGRRLRLAFKLFDSEGVAVVNMLKDGRQALEATRKESRDLGLVWEDSLIRSAEKAHDALSRMEKIVELNFARLALQLAPTIIRIGEEFANAAPKIRRAVDAIADFFGAESLLSIEALQHKIEDLQQGIEFDKSLPSLVQTLFGAPGDIAAKEAEIARLQARIQEIRASEDAARRNLAAPGTGDTAAQETAFSKVRDRLLEEFEALTKTDEERQIAVALRQAEVKAGTAQAQQIADIIRATNLESSAIDELMAELDAEAKAEEEAAAKKAELTKQRAEAKTQVLQEIAYTQDLIAAYGEGEDAINAVNDAYAVLNAAKSANIDLSTAEGQQFADNVRQLENLKRQLAGLHGQTVTASEDFQDIGRSFGQAAEDAVLAGAKIGDVLAALEEDLLRIGFRAAITTPIEKFFGGLFPNGPQGGGGLFGSNGLFANLFGGGLFSGLFADGGTIRRGHWGIVGERGPEPVFAGTGDLKVMPHEAMGGHTIYVDVSAPMDPNTAGMVGWQIADSIKSQLARRP